MKKLAQILLILFFMPTGVSAFQTLYTVGFGPRSTALAGAVEASPEDASTLWYNPAGANHFSEVTLSASYLYLTADLEFNGASVDTENLRGIQGALAFPFHFLGRKWTVGVGAFIPDQTLSRVRILPVTEPRFVIYHTDFHQVSVFPAFSVDVTRYLALGITVGLLATNEGEGQFIEADIEEQRADVAFDLESQNQAAPALGLLFEMAKLDDSLPDVRIGFLYRESLSVTFAVPGDINIQSTTTDPDTGEQTTQSFFNADSLTEASIFWVPREVALGAAYPWSDRWLLLGGLVWRQWSEFPNQALQGVDNVSLFGGTSGETNLPPFVDPNFSDTLNPKLGVEYIGVDGPKAKIALRGGYAFHPSPAPDPTSAELNYLDNDKHIFSLGAGFTFENFSQTILHPLSFDLFAQYVYLPSRVALKEENDPIGDYDYDGQTFAGGAGLTMQF
ncbi:MAG: outer membrane protein transport protein [Deltaproteobacteria bacterium]|nr:outer membrane protein transport protein [Deltaproteobacteria bacterium]